jgi:hypothetical protein
MKLPQATGSGCDEAAAGCVPLGSVWAESHLASTETSSGAKAFATLAMQSGAFA